MYSSLCLCLCEHLAKDISHSAIYRSSETFPFHLKGFVIQRLLHVCVCVRVCVCVQIHSTKRTRDLKRASNCSEMSQKGGLARGYKPVVGVRAFLAEDQTEDSTTAKSGTVFFPHFAFPLSLSLLLCNNCCTCSHFWGKKKICFNYRATAWTWTQTQDKKKKKNPKQVGQWLQCTHGQNVCGDNREVKGIISTKKNRNHRNKTLLYTQLTLCHDH